MSQRDRAREQRIVFRGVDIERDVDQLQVWLADPDVQPWYDEGELTRKRLLAKFAPEPHMRRFIFSIDDIPAGYLQAYRLSDEPEYMEQLDQTEDAGAMDLFIGNEAFRNSGWGTHILRAALERVIFGEMDCDLAMIAPDPENARAVASYERAGYVADRTVYIVDDEPGNTGYELLMFQTREAFERG